MNKLLNSFEKCGNCLCVGIDPELDKLGIGVEGLLDYTLGLVEKINEENLCFTFKLNMAFYGALGEPGAGTLQKTCEKLGKENFLILDGKRADIPNTMRMYARELGVYGADAVTTLPWFGVEAVRELAKENNSLVYVVAKPTNPGAMADLELKDGTMLWEKVVGMFEGIGNIGYVVPPEGEVVKRLADKPLLLPGVGKQGYSSEEIIKLLKPIHRVNVGRSIMFPGDKFKSSLDAVGHHAEMLKIKS